MAYPNRNGLEMMHFNMHSLDVTTSGADRCFGAFKSPIRGRLVRLKATPYFTTSGTADVVTVKIGSVTVSGATVSFVSGTAAGVAYSADSTNSPIVHQGDIVSVLSNGAGTDGTVACTLQVSIRRI
jgi:hypothetical protein